MADVGDVVIYGTGGVCRITDRRVENFGGSPREYLILSRLSEKERTTIFVPADNEALLATMQKVIAPEEWEGLRRSATPYTEEEWSTDGRIRVKRMREVLGSASREALIRLILTLGGNLLDGGKYTTAEENACHRAAAMLYEELSLVFSLKLDDVIPYLLGRMDLSVK